MSNYPPGVTGNEWQIAGPREWDASMECGEEGFTVRTHSHVSVVLLSKVLTEIGTMSRASIEHFLRQIKADFDTVDVDTPCPFSGDVTVYQTDGPPTWECPLCRAQHYEED